MLWATKSLITQLDIKFFIITTNSDQERLFIDLILLGMRKKLKVLKYCLC